MTRRCLSWSMLLCAGGLAAQAQGEAWPQYHGASSDRAVQASLPAGWLSDPGPRVAWKVPANTGFSSFVVDGERAYTLVRREVDGADREVCVALDAATGEERWAAALAASEYDGGGGAGAPGNSGGDGPRGTPSVVDGRVHVYDARLVLHTLDAASGGELWRVDVAAAHGGRDVKWQNASSPVVDGGRVFVGGGGAGQSLLAFDAKTGERIWATADEHITHATPIVADLHGVRQVIFYVRSGLVACDVANGDVLWRLDYPYRTSSAASPVVAGDVVYLSAGYGVGAGAYRVLRRDGRFATELLWRKRNKLMNHWSTPVHRDGHLYGLFGFKKYGEAPLQCVELATGDVKWSAPDFGPGNVILVGEQLVVLSDAGELVVADATPEAYRERSRTRAVDGKCWSSPAYAGGRVFVRSTREAACLSASRP